jgi:proteasome-associated ATPase
VDIEDPELQALLERLADSNPDAMSIHDQFAVVTRTRERSAEAGLTLDRWLLYEINDLRRTVREVQARQADLRKLHERLTAPPWYTGVFLRTIDGSPVRAVVSYLAAPRVVNIAEEVAADTLVVGDDVLLSHDLNLLLRKLTPGVKRMSEVGEFQHRLSGERVLLKVRDGDAVAHAAGTLDLDLLRHGDRVLWDPALAMAFERLPRPAESAHFLSDTPKERFADIGGLDRQIEQLQRAVALHAQHPDLVARYGLKRASAVLLVGPPGTGKTMLARALAQWLGKGSSSGTSRFLDIKPGALNSMWWGQSEANYRELFRVARETAAAHPGMPVVMFFDEVDSIGVTRSSEPLQHAAGRVLESFMTELDGLQARGNILVVAATNRRDALDPALLRPGRLGDLVIEVPRPNMAAARSILERHFPTFAPYAPGDDAAAARCDVIDAAVSHLYAPNGAGDVASLMFRDGTRRPVRARDLVSGAMLSNVARAATEHACLRELEGGERGVTSADALDAVADQLDSAVATLTPANCHAHLANLPQDLPVVRVDSTAGRPRRPHRFLRLASAGSGVQP